MSWNAKVRCVKSKSLVFKFDKVYEIEDGVLIDEGGIGHYVGLNVQTLNNKFNSQFELAEEPTRYTQLAAYKLILEDLSREFECEYQGKKNTLKYNNDTNSIFMYNKFGNVVAFAPYWLDSEWTEVEKRWMPKYGESYWTVDFTRNEMVEIYGCDFDVLDECLINTCGVYKTKEEAVEVAKKMLKALEV